MTRDTAIRKIRTALGPKAYWRVGAHLTSPERRRAHTLTVLDAQFAAAMVKRDRDDRRRAILDADPVYRALVSEAADADKHAEHARYHDGGAGYRFEVGTVDGIFRQPKAYGDTWEEIFAKLAGGAS